MSDFEFVLVEQIGFTFQETVFELVFAGARGPRGPAGTIGTLDLLDSKATPVDADLMLVGDSAASFANKSTTWANIKATLKAFFDLVYQPLSSALSKITEAGGLPLWDGGAWPSGGDWELIEDRAMSGNVAELFTVGTDDRIKFELEGYGWDAATSGALFAFSEDGGATYPSTHMQAGIRHFSGSTVLSGEQLRNAANFQLIVGVDRYQITCKIDISNINSGDATFALSNGRINYQGGSNVFRIASSGLLANSTLVNKIKFYTSNGNAINLGRIKLFKYVGD